MDSLEATNMRCRCVHNQWAYIENNLQYLKHSGYLLATQLPEYPVVQIDDDVISTLIPSAVDSSLIPSSTVDTPLDTSSTGSTTKAAISL
jgi:hypothetical protein